MKLGGDVGVDDKALEVVDEGGADEGEDGGVGADGGDGAADDDVPGEVFGVRVGVYR